MKPRMLVVARISAFQPEYSILKKLSVIIMTNRGIVFLYGFFRIIYYYYYA